jgi:argininosuccinate lyase
MPFRSAHEKVGEVIRYAEEQGVELSAVPLAVYQEIAPEFGDDVKEVFDYMAAVEKKDSIGGTAPQAVRSQIAAAKDLLAG